MLAALALALALTQDLHRSLEVFLVDEGGELLVEGWTVHAGHWVNDRPQFTTSAKIDGTSGRASLTEVIGVVVVQARHTTGEATHCEQVRVADSGATVFELALEGPPPERSLFVELLNNSPLAADLRPTELVAVDAAGAVAATLTPNEKGLFIARGVPAGHYRIEVLDPSFEAVLIERHPTGVRARVTPVGSAQVAVRFVDAVDGRQLTPESVYVTAMRARVNPTGSFRTSTSGSVREFKPGVAVPIVPGTTLELEAQFLEHPDLLHTIEPLEPRESREVVVSVPRGAVCEGRVQSVDGHPIEGVVWRTALSSQSWVSRPSQGGFVLRNNTLLTGGSAASLGRPAALARALGGPTRERTARTDAHGEFELTGLPLDTQRVFVCSTPWHAEAITVRRAPESGELLPLDHRLPERGGADVTFQASMPLDFIPVHIRLQIGDAAPLAPGARQAPLTIDNTLMPLRGLPTVPCKLYVDPLPAAAGAETRKGLVVEFTPALGAATPVTVDLRPFER